MVFKVSVVSLCAADLEPNSPKHCQPFLKQKKKKKKKKKILQNSQVGWFHTVSPPDRYRGHKSHTSDRLQSSCDSYMTPILVVM